MSPKTRLSMSTSPLSPTPYNLIRTIHPYFLPWSHILSFLDNYRSNSTVDTHVERSVGLNGRKRSEMHRRGVSGSDTIELVIEDVSPTEESLPIIVVSNDMDASPVDAEQDAFAIASEGSVTSRAATKRKRSIPTLSIVVPEPPTTQPFTLPLLFQTYRLALISFGVESLPQDYLQDLTVFEGTEELASLHKISHHYMQFTHRYMHFLRQKLFYVDTWLMHDRLGLDTHFDTLKQKRMLAFYDSFIFTLRYRDKQTDHSLHQLQLFARLVPNATIYLLLFEFHDKDKVLDIARSLSLMDVRVFDVSVGGEIVSRQRHRNSGIWQSFAIEDPSSFKRQSTLLPPESIFSLVTSSDDEASSPVNRIRRDPNTNTGGGIVFRFLRRGKISDLTRRINSILMFFDDRYRLVPTHATDRDLLEENSPITIVEQLLQMRNSSIFTETFEHIARNSLLEPNLSDVMYGPLTEYLNPSERDWVNGVNPSKILLRLGWNSLRSEVRARLIRQFFTMYIFPKLMEHCYVFHRESYKNLRTFSAYLYRRGKWSSAAFGNHGFTPPSFDVDPETGNIVATYWIVHQRVTRYFFTRKTVIFPRDLTECRLTVVDQRYSVSRRWTIVRLFILSLCCCFCCGRVKF